MYVYVRNYTAGTEKVMSHTNKIVFMLVVHKVLLYFIYCMFPTILIGSPLNYVKLSRFLRNICWMDVTRVNDKRELHTVIKRKFFMLLLYNIWKH